MFLCNGVIKLDNFSLAKMKVIVEDKELDSLKNSNEGLRTINLLFKAEEHTAASSIPASLCKG